jgi:hypothetical protein
MGKGECQKSSSPPARAPLPGAKVPGIDFDIVKDGVIYRCYNPYMMIIAWAWYEVVSPGIIALCALSLR